MALSDWRHISTFTVKPDIESALKSFMRKAVSSLAIFTKGRTMSNVPREGGGAFFPQRDKKHPKAPDWKGQIMHQGNIIKLSGWFKTSAYGQFISLAVDNYQAQPQQYPKEVAPPKGAADPFDDNTIPF